jgi:hypothetical protein
MNFIKKILTFTIPVPKTEFGQNDYIYIYDSADLNTPLSDKLRGVSSGDNYVFTWKTNIAQPAVRNYIYIAYDQYGNAGTASGDVEQDSTDMVPQKPGQLGLFLADHFTSISID